VQEGVSRGPAHALCGVFGESFRNDSLSASAACSESQRECWPVLVGRNWASKLASASASCLVAQQPGLAPISFQHSYRYWSARSLILSHGWGKGRRWFWQLLWVRDWELQELVELCMIVAKLTDRSFWWLGGILVPAATKRHSQPPAELAHMYDETREPL
jgi:hypothetical protein